jgi:hypothetical protein
VRTSAGTVGRPMWRRLFQAHHSRKPRRCQAMTVSGLTMTSAVRHPGQMRKSWPQSQRSAFASRNRRGRVCCSTCNWCRNARTSSWSAVRERTHVRRLRTRHRSTDIIAPKRMHRWPQHQRPQQERTFQSGHRRVAPTKHMQRSIEFVREPEWTLNFCAVACSDVINSAFLFTARPFRAIVR